MFYCQQWEKVLGDRGDGRGRTLRRAMSNVYNTILALKETYNQPFRKKSMLDILLSAAKGDIR